MYKEVKINDNNGNIRDLTELNLIDAFVAIEDCLDCKTADELEYTINNYVKDGEYYYFIFKDNEVKTILEVSCWSIEDPLEADSFYLTFIK